MPFSLPPSRVRLVTAPPTPPRYASDTDELDDTGTFNNANEWLTRDLDNNSGTTGNNFTLAYDAAGNMTDDGRNYEYVWDGFGRLRQVKRTDNQALVAEYRYNGLGYRLSWKYDTDGDLDVDGSDQTYFFVYDLKWRPVATYRGTDANPKERFIFHNAGLAGRGTSSYIDSVIMRDKDANTAWDAASDATLEERRYYVQNWRADVVALLTAGGDVSEWVRYSAYGEATVYPFVNGDFDADGDVDGDDTIAFSAAWDSSANAADVDRANGVDGDDVIAFAAAWDAGYATTAWTAGGGLPANAGQLSVTSGNRIGYAGYQFDPATEQYHVRHRVYSPEMGRWTRRDPIGYVDGMGLYEYVAGRPVTHSDVHGLAISRPRCTFPLNVVVHPSCVEHDTIRDALCKAFQDPHLLQVYIRLCARISPGCTGCVEVRCAPSREGGRGSYGSCYLELNYNPESQEFNNTDVIRTIAHELEHALQEEWWGPIGNCRDRLCREIHAYAIEGACRTVHPNNYSGCLCDRACDSVVADTMFCFSGGNATPSITPGYVEYPPWKTRKERCVDACHAQFRQCRSGMNPFVR